MTRYPLPRENLWIIKRGKGRNQPYAIGWTLVAGALFITLITVILAVGIDPMFTVIAAVFAFPSFLIGLALLSTVRKREYYHISVMIRPKEGTITFKDTKRFIEDFLGRNRVRYDTEVANIDREYRWWFKGREEGMVFVWALENWVYYVGMKDQDGTHEDMVDEFMRGFSSRFGLPFRTYKWKGLIG
ncbi:MAG: hypothetical protein ACMUHB_04090 [Thermoplasmatota archaeon]